MQHSLTGRGYFDKKAEMQKSIRMEEGLLDSKNVIYIRIVNLQ